MNANTQAQYSIESQLTESQMKFNRDIFDFKLRLSSMVTQTDDPPTCHTGGQAKPTPVGTHIVPSN